MKARSRPNASCPFLFFLSFFLLAHEHEFADDGVAAVVDGGRAAQSVVNVGAAVAGEIQAEGALPRALAGADVGRGGVAALVERGPAAAVVAALEHPAAGHVVVAPAPPHGIGLHHLGAGKLHLYPGVADVVRVGMPAAADVVEGVVEGFAGGARSVQHRTGGELGARQILASARLYLRQDHR